MAYQPKKLKEALFPILIANWISGLGMVEYPLGTFRFFISFIYVIICLSGYFYVPLTGGNNACNFNTKPNPGTNLYRALLIYDGFIVIISIIICWYYQKEMQVCIQRIELVDETLECLGTTDNWGSIFRKELLRLIQSLIGTSIPFVSTIMWYQSFMNISDSMYCSFRFHAPIFLMTIVDLTFGTIISCVGYSMKSINFILENAVKKGLKLKENFEVNHKHHRIITVITSTEFNSETAEKTKNLIQLLKQMHLELSKIAWNINKIFGLQMVMASVANIVLLILDSYYVTKVTIHAKHFDKHIFISSICTVSSFLSRFARIVTTNKICGQVAKEAGKANEIIFELNKGNENTELTEEIEQFALQIRQRPLNFSMCGLFTLEHKLVGCILATAVTYLVCLIEIGPEEIQLEENNTTEIITAAIDLINSTIMDYNIN